jgi:teichuronic acid biosynthesis glycosyltransferase TuaC
MNIGILLPGFSSHENDWAIPVQLNLVREMAKHDEVRVLALRYPHRRDRYTVFGTEVISLGVGQVRAIGRLRLWANALWMLRKLHAEKPFDVLHAMWADETGLIAAWAGRWLKVPVVVSIAGGELVGFDDIGYGLQRSRFSRWIVGQALTGADRVIPACTYTQALIGKAGYLVPTSKIKIITLGVDAERFHPKDITSPPRIRGGDRGVGLKKKTLIHTASLVSIKDQATLLRALARLDGVTLDILGTGPEEARLKSLAAELNLSGRVNFLGSVQHVDLPAHYQQAALNVLSSRHEGLGMVTLEAAACGVPTVSTAVGLLPDVPLMGVTVPVGDDLALATTIDDLLSNPQKLSTMGQSALETVRRGYTIRHTVDHFRTLYRSLI